MRIVSMFFTVVLVFPIAFFVLHIFQLYDNDSLKLFGVKNDLLFDMAKGSITLLTVYVVAFVIAIFLNLKKRYVANSIFVSVMFAIYMIITAFQV
jgi:hypothetical protein